MVLGILDLDRARRTPLDVHFESALDEPHLRRERRIAGDDLHERGEDRVVAAVEHVTAGTERPDRLAFLEEHRLLGLRNDQLGQSRGFHHHPHHETELAALGR